MILLIRQNDRLTDAPSVRSDVSGEDPLLGMRMGFEVRLTSTCSLATHSLIQI